MPGNIGYLRFDAFVDTDEAEATGASVMTLPAVLRRADRGPAEQRQGGSPEMIQFLTSYLFEERVHLNDMVDRDGMIVEEYCDAGGGSRRAIAGRTCRCSC